MRTGLLRKLRIILKDRGGVSLPLMVGVTLSLLLVFCGVSEYFRLQIIAAGIRGVMEDAIISTVNDGHTGVCHGTRKEYSGGCMPHGEGEREGTPDEGDIYIRINETLGTRKRGGRHMKFAGDNGNVVEFALTDLDVTLRNAPLTPSDPGNVRRFEMEVIIRLEVPVRFGRKFLLSMYITLRVQAGHTEVF